MITNKHTLIALHRVNTFIIYRNSFDCEFSSSFSSKLTTLRIRKNRLDGVYMNQNSLISMHKNVRQ